MQPVKPDFSRSCKARAQMNSHNVDKAAVNHEKLKDRFAEMNQIALESGNYQFDVNSAVSLTFKTSKFACARAPNWQEKPFPLSSIDKLV